MDPKKVIIATPIDGRVATANVSFAYHTGVRQLERAGAVILKSDVLFTEDLARGRSMAVRIALALPIEWEWMLWWDEDVAVPDTTIVPRMIEAAESAGYKILGAPYPRKRMPLCYPYKPIEEQHRAGSLKVEHNTIEAEFIPAGFMLTHRSALETMVKKYADLWFTEYHEESGQTFETVALFWPILSEPGVANSGGTERRYRELYSEDFSFCIRWRRIGGKLGLYVGPGSPLAHIGRFAYQGTREDLGRVG